MLISDFDYALPEGRIAQRPMEPREAARLLVSGWDGSIADKHVGDLPALLRPNDLLVFNDTKVIPARLFGYRGGVKVEVMLDHALPDGGWQAFARPLKRLREGDRIVFGPDFSATVHAKDKDAGVLSLRFHIDEAGEGGGGETGALQAALLRYGHVPLPPYIDRADDVRDTEDYQSIFAKHEGAVAAPTASFHFTDALMAQIGARGIAHDFVTLHVGAGTWQPVRARDTEDHIMHAEWIEVSQAVIDRIAATKAAGGRIVAVGTTALRALESAAGDGGKLSPTIGETRLFITPGYRFNVVDVLLTNFHLPKSTLLMLVSAFAGMETIRTLYQHAIENEYRFFSYGDACLLEGALTS